MPRIPPIPPDERDDTVEQLLDLVRLPGGGGEMDDANIFTTLVRAPRVFKRWIAFGGTLLSGRLPARDREILILRTGWNCHSPYEWGQHVRIGMVAGLQGEEIERLAGTPADAFDDADGLLVRAADELHRDSTLSDATWAGLAARYDDEQLIELLMVVGHYHLVAMTLNSLDVEMDEGLSGIPSS